MKLLLAPAVALLGACAPIRYSSQEVLLRHRAEPDTLDVLILYDGLQAEPQQGDRDGVGEASSFAGRVAMGKREFMLVDWPMHLDLEEIVENLAKIDPGSTDPWDVWQREGFEHLEGIHVVASGLYAGEENRISLYQRFRVEHWSRVVEWLDRSLRIAIAECEANGSLDQHLPYLNAETRAAWAAWSKTKTRWLSIVDGGLEVRLPMNPSDAARVLAWFLEQSKDADAARFFAGLSAGMGAIEVASDHVRLVWRTEDGMVRFRFDGAEDYDGSLAQEMRSSKDFPRKLTAREDVIRLFRGD